MAACTPILYPSILAGSVRADGRRSSSAARLPVAALFTLLTLTHPMIGGGVAHATDGGDRHGVAGPESPRPPAEAGGGPGFSLGRYRADRR